jgi:hypothetical protein
MDELLMSGLYVLQIQYITGASSFNADPGFFYRVDCSAGDVTAKLPSAQNVVDVPGAWLIIKNVTGSNNVIVTPVSGEAINQSPSQAISGTNQGHSYLPCLRPSYGIGWVSW